MKKVPSISFFSSCAEKISLRGFIQKYQKVEKYLNLHLLAIAELKSIETFKNNKMENV